MPGVSIDTFGALMINYMRGVRKTLNNSTNARKIPKGTVRWEGKNLQWFVHVGRNGAIASVADGGAFPTAGKQSYVEAKATRKNTIGSVQITDGLLNTASSTEKAAISAVESELTGLMDGIRKYENYFFTRDGTGVVTTLGATTSGSTITVDDARALWDGKDYEIRSTAAGNAVLVSSFTVSSVARSFNASNEAVVTPSASVASSGQADGSYIVWGSGSSSSWGRVFNGLDLLIDDSTSGTFQNVSTSTYPRYTSPVLSNSGTNRALTPSLFRQMLAMIKQESGDDPPNGMTVLTNIWQSVSVEEMYEGELRLRPDDTTFGVAASSFQSTLGKINIVTDPDCPYNKMFFLDPSEITFAVQAELDWRRDGSGSPIFKRSDQSLNYTATALETNELIISQRNKCGKIEDLVETKSSAY
jgi:hypothetical protein